MASDNILTFEEIYNEQSDAIFRFCVLRVSNRSQAMDITQETFLRLWQCLEDKQDILNPRAFLYTIARRLIIDWYRKKKSISLDSIFDGEEDESSIADGITSGENLELRAEGRYLIDQIRELAPTYRDPVYLRFVEGLSPGEIGEILGISANAASVRVNRGIIELRKKTGYGKNNE